MEYGVPAAAPQPAAPVQASAPVQTQTPPVSEPDDLPPWDLEPPPVREAPPKAPAPSAPQPAPRSAPNSAAAPKAPAPSSPGDTAFWNALTPALMGKVPMGEYTFLIDPSMTQGDYRDGVLNLWADSDFVKGMLEKPSVLDPVSREAERMAGRPVQVFVKVGRPPVQAPAAPSAPAAEHDNLDDLLALGRQFDNINIKE